MKRGRVLIIDDERVLCASLARMLRKDFEVVTASDGIAGLEQLKGDEAFHAIVCDIQMRDMSGPALRDAIRRVRPELTYRMIFMTGDVHSELSSRVKDHHILQKPFDNHALRTLLIRIVDSAIDGSFPNP